MRSRKVMHFALSLPGDGAPPRPPPRPFAQPVVLSLTEATSNSGRAGDCPRVNGAFQRHIATVNVITMVRGPRTVMLAPAATLPDPRTLLLAQDCVHHIASNIVPKMMAVISPATSNRDMPASSGVCASILGAIKSATIGRIVPSQTIHAKVM